MSGICLDEKYANFTIEKNFDFSKNATIGCGGVAPASVYTKNAQECVTLLRYLKADNLPYQIVGNLSNVLPKSGTYDKVLISTKHLCEITLDKELFVGAGVTSGAFLRFCKENGLSGGEFLVGIPCTIGGALYMNAGVAGRYIGELVESVTVVREGELQTLTRAKCAYAYKQSVFMQTGDFIVGASLRLKRAPQAEILENIQAYTKRRAHLPKGKSMGCVFKNPKNLVAGELIEGAGLKGLRVGGAQVSNEHANFIINDKGATPEQIKTLIKIIQNAVFAQYNIRLEEEIRYL